MAGIWEQLAWSDRNLIFFDQPADDCVLDDEDVASIL